MTYQRSVSECAANPLPRLAARHSAAFRLPPAVDFPFPAPLRGLRFFRRDRGIPIKGFVVGPPCLFLKIVEVAQERRSSAFPGSLYSGRDTPPAINSFIPN